MKEILFIFKRKGIGEGVGGEPPEEGESSPNYE